MAPVVAPSPFFLSTPSTPPIPRRRRLLVASFALFFLFSCRVGPPRWPKRSNKRVVSQAGSRRLRQLLLLLWWLSGFVAFCAATLPSEMSQKKKKDTDAKIAMPKFMPNSTSVPSTAQNKALKYAQISKNIIGKPDPNLNPEECRAACVADEACVAWEVCAPLGDGCDGCYRVEGRKIKLLDDKEGWVSELFPHRMDGLPESGIRVDVTSPESCRNFLLQSHGGIPDNDFHNLENLKAYSDCGALLAATHSTNNATTTDQANPKQLHMAGHHHPTVIVVNHVDPPILLPPDVEADFLRDAQRTPREPLSARPEGFTPDGEHFVKIADELHKNTGTREFPPGPQHAFVVPFYDTNIGHWIKAHGTMNPLQSYEMQSLLRDGDVVVDVGANLGAFTIPLSEKVGKRGAIIAFEPFRWMFQFLTANVALNGLQNVWTVNMALGARASSFDARPPQLHFFSSPGGMRLQSQTDGLRDEDAMQLYDFDTMPEVVAMARLDDILSNPLLADSPNLPAARVPQRDSVRLIKIDVEGMETDVMEGARETVRQFKPIVWSENVAYFQDGDTTFIELMASMNYTCAVAQNAPNDVICVDADGQGHQI